MIRLVWLTRLLTVGGVLETGAGLGLLVDPALLVSVLLRSPLAGPGVVIARLAGAALLALGIACWRARSTPATPASIGVSWAFLVYNGIACATLAWAGIALVSGGLAALGAAVLHGVLGLALLAALLGRSQT